VAVSAILREVVVLAIDREAEVDEIVREVTATPIDREVDILCAA